MNGPVAVFAVGNRSRGDDALGPLLLDRLQAWLEAEGLAGRFALVEEYQLQVENALDLEGSALALFIDADAAARQPVTLARVRGEAPPAFHSTHALSPQAVLAVHRRLTGREAPPSFTLAVRGSSFGLGAAPSAAGLSALEAAWGTLQALCRSPGEGPWSRMAAIARAERA